MVVSLGFEFAPQYLHGLTKTRGTVKHIKFNVSNNNSKVIYYSQDKYCQLLASWLKSPNFTTRETDLKLSFYSHSMHTSMRMPKIPSLEWVLANNSLEERPLFILQGGASCDLTKGYAEVPAAGQCVLQFSEMSL